MPEELRAEALKNRDALISGTELIWRPFGNAKTVSALTFPRREGISFSFGPSSRLLHLSRYYRAQESRKRTQGGVEGYLAEAQNDSHGQLGLECAHRRSLWSRRFFSIYGYEYQQMGPTWPQFLERIHPEDRPQIEQSARMRPLERVARFQITFESFSERHHNHLHSVAHPVRDDSGEITEVVALS